jgi:16S rRNA (uracil1498-N3)-methyltransferase
MDVEKGPQLGAFFCGSNSQSRLVAFILSKSSIFCYRMPMKTLHRFFVHPTAIGKDRVTITDMDQVRQMTKVLRMHEGDHLIVLNNAGKEYEVKIMEIAKKSVTCRHVEERDVTGEPKVLIRLLQGLPKQPSKFEEILKHGTELGISEFFPLITQNCEAQELRKRERLENIIKEAAEQSERGHLPILGPEVLFSPVLDGGWPPELEADVTLLAYARETKTLLPDVLQQLGAVKSINIVVGPEGGFTEEEIKLVHKQHFTTFGLGKRILRTETAGVAIVSALLLGSFSPDL